MHRTMSRKIRRRCLLINLSTTFDANVIDMFSVFSLTSLSWLSTVSSIVSWRLICTMVAKDLNYESWKVYLCLFLT